MERAKYFDSIEGKLNWLATRLDRRGRLNLLDLNLHSEGLYQHLINIVFDWELKNLNAVQHNAPGIDLIDTTNHIIAQVSATSTKQKIESALAKVPSGYIGYNFKFISISKDANTLRTKRYNNPHNLKFSPDDDIIDIASLLRIIKDMAIDKLQQVYEFLEKEVKIDPSPEKVESNLATIIVILSKENWSQGGFGPGVAPYDIEAKITYNHLDSARFLIDDYKIHYSRIDKIYSDFDRQGANKSLSILNGIRKEYAELGSSDTPDNRFFSIIKRVIEKIRRSSNYTHIASEELELCVHILVVDAFIRCKIFENPLGNSDASS